VTTHSIELMGVDGAEVLLTVACSAGFYVRSLAHDLGAMLGTGAHLIGLRRTRAGAATLDHAIALEEAERDAAAARCRVIPLRALLPDLPAAVLSPEGVTRAGHGRELGPADFTHMLDTRIAGRLRLLDEHGELIGIGVPGAMPGLLHPSIVLM
jgi:tRNA pseudouridine55 synthase